MKRVLITLSLLSLIMTNAWGQITMSHAANAAAPKRMPYDSTLNYLGSNNVESYIGQTLFVKGRHKDLQGWGYDDFHKKKGEILGHWGRNAEKSEFSTKYEDLAGKYFSVIDVEKASDEYQPIERWGKTYWFLLREVDNLLEENHNKEDIWFFYQGDYEFTFPFITLSYFNYLRNSIIGKSFILSYTIKEGVVRENYLTENDFKTGESIVFSKDNVWECVDVTIEDTYYELVLIVKNQQGQFSTMKPERINPENGKISAIEVSEWEALRIKYGDDVADAIRRHVIIIGMPEEAVIMSWGKPEKINRSSHGSDQWIYDNQYVYIEDGVVKACVNCHRKVNSFANES